jgi:hypothetical protein
MVAPPDAGTLMLAARLPGILGRSNPPSRPVLGSKLRNTPARRERRKLAAMLAK